MANTLKSRFLTSWFKVEQTVVSWFNQARNFFSSKKPPTPAPKPAPAVTRASSALSQEMWQREAKVKAALTAFSKAKMNPAADDAALSHAKDKLEQAYQEYLEQVPNLPKKSPVFTVPIQGAKIALDSYYTNKVEKALSALRKAEIGINNTTLVAEAKAAVTAAYQEYQGKVDSPKPLADLKAKVAAKAAVMKDSADRLAFVAEKEVKATGAVAPNMTSKDKAVLQQAQHELHAVLQQQAVSTPSIASMAASRPTAEAENAFRAYQQAVVTTYQPPQTQVDSPRPQSWMASAQPQQHTATEDDDFGIMVETKDGIVSLENYGPTR